MHQQAIDFYRKGSPQADRTIAIIQAILDGEKQIDIAERFFIQRSTVSEIKKRYLN